jgi:hypothetical protein
MELSLGLNNDRDWKSLMQLMEKCIDCFEEMVEIRVYFRDNFGYLRKYTYYHEQNVARNINVKVLLARNHMEPCK